MMNLLKISFFLFLTISFFSCKKTEVLDFENAKDYYPTVVGKYITYKLDSTNYIGYTSVGTITTYFARDVIDAAVTDNLGRPAFRVIRYRKKLLTDLAWIPMSTYWITPLDKSIEVNENNLRFIKLQNPVREAFSWKGNTYIETSGQYSSFQYLFDWEYQYSGIKESKTYGTMNFPETITVNQADATDGIVTDPNGYSERNYSVEVYAKGTGLVFKEFLHWSYQPPSGNIPGYRSGYGIKLSIVDKN